MVDILLCSWTICTFAIAFSCQIAGLIFDLTKLPTCLVPNLVNGSWLLWISRAFVSYKWLTFFKRDSLLTYFPFSMSCLCRRAASCAGMDVDTQTRQLIRQYSVATPQISPKRPFRLPRTSTFVLVSAWDRSGWTLKIDINLKIFELLKLWTMF